MKKLNRTQRARRASGFAAMSPRGNKRNPSAASPWRNVFPIAEPEPIVQKHFSRGKAIVASTIVPTVERDPVTGKYPTDADGKVPAKVVPVCLHRCTHINMRHGSKAERRA